jgi:hypothetical protein
MQENTKQVIVKMTARRAFRTEPIWQYDTGHELVFEGFEGLPATFQVHFSLSPAGNSVTQVGQNGVCTLPDMYTRTAAPIYAWLYIVETDTGLTKYSIEIPVQRRAKITNQEPTPVQQDAIDQAIAALNAGAAAAEEAQEAAEAAQASAESYAESAGNSAITATNAATSAAASATSAAGSATAAAASATDANSSREAADVSATAAGVSERNAKSSETAAAGSAASAASSASAASGSATAAGSAKDSAAASATAAAGSATAASGSASAAAESATAAAGSATSAGTSATAAAGSATSAGTSATAAAGSATAAAGSATAAGQSATAAAGSAAAAQEVLESIPEDYSDLSDDVDSLKSALDNGISSTLDLTEKNAVGTSNNYKLKDNGDRTSDANYCIKQFSVSVGKVYKIVSDHKFQFSAGTTPYGSTRKGITYGVGTYYCICPAEAKFLLVSTTKEDNNISVSESLSINTRVTTLETNLSGLSGLSINADIEIGINRYIYNGVLVRAVNANRASTAPSAVTYDTLYVYPQGYTINLFVQRDEVWENGVEDATQPFSYTFTDETAYAFQVESNSAIPENAVPFTIGFNLPSSLKKVADIATSQIIPSGLTRYEYKGEAISVGHKIAYEPYMTISTETTAVVQGCTAYGKYLFVAYNTLPMISVYDLKQKSHIANIQMTAVDTYHCNNINFGSEKHSPDDTFPLLYVSMENIAEHKALVFRIQESGGTYSATLVQTITYPDPTSASMYYPNCVVDAVNKRLCVMGYSTNSYVKSATNKIKVDVYDLPLLSDGNVQLDRANAKKSIEVMSLTATQGAFVSGDNIVQVYGLPSIDNVTYLGQLSLSGGVYTTLINLTDIGLVVEPESVFVYDDGIYILFVGRAIYRIYLA